MPLSIESITEISRAVASRHRGGFEVIGVTSTEGGSDRVELLLTIRGCHTGPCRLSLNVNRADGEEFERDLTAKLDEALRDHLQKDSPE